MTASRHGPQIGPEEAANLEAARERMIARHKLIERMIHNNERQLKNESARGGAEIERECAKRDAAAPDAGEAAAAALASISQRLAALEEERWRLVSEREWLNTALLTFESGVSDEDHKRAGHA